MYIWVGGLGGFSRVCVNTHASYGGCVSYGVMSADCKSVSGATGKTSSTFNRNFYHNHPTQT